MYTVNSNTYCLRDQWGRAWAVKGEKKKIIQADFPYQCLLYYCLFWQVPFMSIGWKMKHLQLIPFISSSLWIKSNVNDKEKHPLNLEASPSNQQVFATITITLWLCFGWGWGGAIDKWRVTRGLEKKRKKSLQQDCVKTSHWSRKKGQCAVSWRREYGERKQP